MPNWCTNQIHVFGSKGEIRDFHASLNKIIAANKKENTSHHWLYDVSEFFHCDTDNLPCRGELFPETIKYDEEKAPETLSFSCCSAWGPNFELWNAIFENCYSTLSFVFAADEPGMGIYVKHDPEHKVFGEDYFLLEYYLGSDIECYECFSAEAEVIDHINDDLDTNIKTIDGLYEYVQKNYLDKDDDFYFNIKQYEDI